MQRRTLLSVGAVTGVLLGLTGTTIAMLRPGRREARFTPSGRALFAAIADSVLGSLLPLSAGARIAAIAAHITRVEATIAGLPPHMQTEIDELITIIGSSPGRLGLARLTTDWTTATQDQVSAALTSMQRSSVSIRQQAFHALRDITNGSYFADPSTWPAIGYPGARPV